MVEKSEIMKPVMKIYLNKCMFSFWEFMGILGFFGGPYWAFCNPKESYVVI